jgi:hypothetical protein
MGRLIKNSPSASVLMNSMRSMGYTFEAALADVIDNSISAQASNIIINFPKDPQHCFVSIIDNGNGMGPNQLYEAMKYGSTLAGNIRSDNDLGRFGLGLKSASLSQCKRLTVASKLNGNICAYIWDLDCVGEDWLIQECDENEIETIINIGQLKQEIKGTLVVWEKFDVLDKSAGNAFSYLNKRIDEVTRYLELIFHRYLNGNQCKKISIKMNEYDLIGLDPFLESHKKTNPRREMYIPIEDSNGIERQIIVRPYVLPFQKDLTQSDIETMGGLENYQIKQGFYIYRNKRLIIWGTWFRMKQRQELTKHARIKVDIPNSLDDIWGIDIKKQNATLPLIIRNQLVKAVEESMEIAIRAQRFRGRVQNINDKIDYIWDRYQVRGNKYKYKINRDSKVFELLKDIDETALQKINLVLDEIEESMPYQQIYLDMSDHIIEDSVSDERKAEIENKARSIFEIYKRFGKDGTQIIEDIFQSEPFNKYLELKAKLLKDLIKE